MSQRIKSSADASGEITADLSAEIVALQQRVEAEHFHSRRQLLAYDHWLDDVRGQLAKAE
jgi:hypothetical protein